MSKALIIGQQLSSEVLRILEDYNVSQVKFHDGKKLGPQSLSSSSERYHLLILNRNETLHRVRRQALRMAKAQKMEILEYSNLPKTLL